MAEVTIQAFVTDADFGSDLEKKPSNDRAQAEIQKIMGHKAGQQAPGFHVYYPEIPPGSDLSDKHENSGADIQSPHEGIGRQVSQSE